MADRNIPSKDRTLLVDTLSDARAYHEEEYRWEKQRIGQGGSEIAAGRARRYADAIAEAALILGQSVPETTDGRPRESRTGALLCQNIAAPLAPRPDCNCVACNEVRTDLANSGLSQLCDKGMHEWCMNRSAEESQCRCECHRSVSKTSADVSRERSPADFAIEHAEYLAKSAEYYLRVVDLYWVIRDQDDPDIGELRKSTTTMVEGHSALESAIYEFRKRAARANQAKP